GDIYSNEYFLRWMRWVERVREDYAYGRASSVDHWRFYSRHKEQLITHIPALQSELAQVLELNSFLLDGSYASLDMVSAACERYGLENVFAALYDNVVAYVGEVIKKRVKGYWEVNTSRS
nr:hypothetical protein [Tanacetum cinerariifolium]